MGQEDVDTTIKVGHKGPVVMALSGTWWPRGQCEEVSFAGLGGTGHRTQGAALLLLTAAGEATIIPK